MACRHFAFVHFAIFGGYSPLFEIKAKPLPRLVAGAKADFRARLNFVAFCAGACLPYA
jgi:hypothetical protein